MKGPKFILELTAGTQGIKGDTGQRGEKGEQGIQGVQGDKGNDGYSPTITEKVNTDREYILTINNKDGSYDTPNLKATNESLGTNGVTFIPSVSEDGIISWTNDGGLENPQSVSIKGPQGPAGKDGRDGVDGEQGPQGEQGLQGPVGQGVAPGGKTKQVLAKNSNNDYDTKWIQIPSQVLDSLDGNSTTEAPSQRAVNEQLESLKVEVIENEKGTAIKYSNGIMICTGIKEFSEVSVVGYGSIYRTASIAFNDFPVEFTQLYNCSYSVNNINDNLFTGIIQIYTATLSNPGNISLLLDKNDKKGTGVLSYNAIGKWK